MYVPAWPATQLGPPPPMPSTQLTPPAPFPVPPSPIMPPAPVAPPQYFGYPPGSGGPMPNYYPAPAQPYLISYPPVLWPPYQQYYPGPHGHVKRILKWPNPTSSLVGTHRSCTLSLLAVSWPLTADLTSSQLTASECPTQHHISLTLPCFGGN